MWGIVGCSLFLGSLRIAETVQAAQIHVTPVEGLTGSELDDKVADIMLLVIGIIPPAVILLLVPVKIALLE